MIVPKVPERLLPLLGFGLVAILGLRLAAADTADLNELVGPYLKARDERTVGEVAGRAYGDPPRPSLPDVPRDGVSVLIFPYSVAFESELDGIKEHLRDSITTYMTAAADVTSARIGYEESLTWVGGGELIRGEVSDTKGLVKLVDVPAGEWLLLAWREDPHLSRPTMPKSKETKGFGEIPVTAGYTLVTFWWTRVQVRAGETTSVDLNDRNTWMTAVRENILLMRASPRSSTSNPSSSPARRR